MTSWWSAAARPGWPGRWRWCGPAVRRWWSIRGEPRNAPASHVHNFLSRDGTPPAQIDAAGRAEVTGYGGKVVTGRVTALSRDGERFLATGPGGRTRRCCSASSAHM